VIGKDIEKNILFIGQGHDHPLLFSQGLTATNLHWISGQLPETPFQCSAKSRYRQADQQCVIEQIENGQCEVRFRVPQRAVTPGQFIVFYQADTCLGGAIIHATRQ
jgi:tRNA-specific 2-thiouridylase